MWLVCALQREDTRRPQRGAREREGVAREENTHKFRAKNTSIMEAAPHPDYDDALSSHALSSYASSSGDSDADRREFGVFRALPTTATHGGGHGSDADSEYDAAVAYLAGVRLVGCVCLAKDERKA